MKIAFVGKGGSGKTTLTAMFAEYLAQQNLSVLAIDADINQHLGTTLGFTNAELTSLPQLGNNLPQLKEYFRGKNKHIGSVEEMLKTTPPGEGSVLMKFKEPSPIFNNFSLAKNCLRFMHTGEFTPEDLGTTCYHAKTGAVELILNHFIDRIGEYIVVDMTAGADAFASGLFTRFDLTVIVVEPTLKSVSVVHQYESYCKDYSADTLLIGNKIRDAEDQQFLIDHFGERMALFISNSTTIRAYERGETQSGIILEPENVLTLQALQKTIDGIQKDWSRYLDTAQKMHERNALGWANQLLGIRAETQIDRNYSYPN